MLLIKHFQLVRKIVLFWFGLIWFDLKQYPYEGFVKVSSRSDIFGHLEKINSWFGLIWFDLKQYPSEGSVKASSRSDLFKRRLLVISLLTLSMCSGLNYPLIFVDTNNTNTLNDP